MGKPEIEASLGPLFSGSADFVSWPILPNIPSLQPIVELTLDTPQFFVMFWNTCKLAFPQILGQFLIGAPAAWAFSKFRFPCRRILFGLYIVLMLLPFQVTMVPNYLVQNSLGLLDTVWCIILPGALSTFPVFIMEKGFDVVPTALLEAASIDGATPLQTFLKIGIPLGLPGIMSAMVLGFLEAWSAIEQPLVFLKDRSLWPLSLFLSEIAQSSLGLAMAASLIALLPAVFVFLFGQKYLELGIQSSGLKE